MQRRKRRKQNGEEMAIRTRNAEYTKKYNRNLLLRLLRKEPLSRAELARRMGLTRAAASLITAELIEEGVIVEMEPVSGMRGRTPTPLKINPEAGYAVGIYLNRDGCSVGITDMTENLILQDEVRMADIVPGRKLAVLGGAVSDLIARSGVDRSRILGIGVSAPGPLNGEGGEILNPPRFDLWHNTLIGPALSEALDMPVFLENNATCLARYHLGKPEAGGSENFLLLLVDSGVGSGVISKGKILKGAGYYTSEIGHISIDLHGRKCSCGNVGCLEAYAAMPHILHGTGYHSWEDLMDHARNDETASEILYQEAEYLSTGIVTLTNLISIDTVLLTGDIWYEAGQLSPVIEELVNQRILTRNRQPVRVRAASNGAGIRILAAADVVFDRILAG